MKLSDALKFSWDRLAEHPGEVDEDGLEGFPIVASDVGITVLVPSKGFFQFKPLTKVWLDLDLTFRHRLLQSDQWQSVNQKPAMMVLAEAYACDWSDPDPSEDESLPDPDPDPDSEPETD